MYATAALTRLIISGVLVVGLWLGLARTDFTPGTRRAVWLAIVLPFAAWQVAIWMLAVQGQFARALGGGVAGPVPAAVILPVLAALPFLLSSKRVASLLDVTPPSWLIGVQVYRVMGVVFLLDWVHGTIPGLFALPAGIGDVTVGLLALPIALGIASGTRDSKRRAVWWNILGLTDLAVALTTGILSTRLANPNVLIGTFPTVLIPTIAVPTSIILHVLSLWQLRRLAQRDSTGAPGTGAQGRENAAVLSPHWRLP
jgi:hypothetical protein